MMELQPQGSLTTPSAPAICTTAVMEKENSLPISQDAPVEQDLGYVTPPEEWHQPDSLLIQNRPNEEQAESNEQNAGLKNDYLGEGDVLLKHLQRQTTIVRDAVADRLTLPISVSELSSAYERNLFSPRVPPKRQANGTCEPNPRLNFYPVFAVPEALATYHIFFKNHKIPVSCRANRTRADELFTLRSGATIPGIVSLEEVPRIFEGLGRDEKRAANTLQKQNEQSQYGTSALVELEGDNARLAVLKRNVSVTHFAYPALNLPPKVMSAVMNQVLIKLAKPIDEQANLQDTETTDDGKPAVSDEQLSRWLGTNDSKELEHRRKLMMGAVLITAELECMHRFFSNSTTLRKIEECLHYTFRHGYVRQACKVSNVELSNLVSYMGILHENRLGQNVLHSTLSGESRRDYVRDCIYLFLLHTWQTGMGVWQQCLEERNLQELHKLLDKSLRCLWTGFDERTVAANLADIIFPERLLITLQNGLPDFMSQSMLHNFRSFILERSGMLPSMCCALPSDFVPIYFKECPPPLWSHCYLLQLANYLAYHSDLMTDSSGEGLMECHCRCNLCTPHRSLVCNTELLSESQLIGTFEMQGPQSDNNTATSFRLTPGLWTSAYLRKFEPEDYHAHTIHFYEDQSRPPKAPLTACVITQGKILAQLQAIKQAREEFLLKKGHGVYLDPQTGEELNLPSPSCATTYSSHPQHAPESRQTGYCSTTFKETAATAGNLGGRILGESGRGGRGLGRMGGGGGIQQPRRGGGGRYRGRSDRRKTVAFNRGLPTEPHSEQISKSQP